MDYQIRMVKPEDLEKIAYVEAQCFPQEEAAGVDSLKQRILCFPESFYVAELSCGTIIGFINGCVTDGNTICDEMFENLKHHNPKGVWQSVFGLDVITEWRNKGVAAALMDYFMAKAEQMGRKGMILTCKKHLIPYYEKFGYKNFGISQSVHGGAIWYDMRLEFGDKGK